MIVAVVVVVVVILAFIGLYFAGAIPGLKPSSTSSGVSDSFSSARAAASSAASRYSSTYPTLAATIGLGLQQPLAGTPSDLAPAAGCTVVPVSGAPTSFTVPAGAGGASSGSLPFWWFIYTGSTGMLFVIVLNGQATALATVATGGSCQASFSSLSAIPADVIDSGAAASAAAPGVAGGAAFLQNHTHANAIFLLLGGVSVSGFGTGAAWEVFYSDCSYAAGSSATSAAQFSASVNGTLGTLTTSATATAACGSLIPGGGTSGGGGGNLGSSITLSTPSEASAGGSYWYNFTVQAAGGGLVWNNMAIEIVHSTGGIVNPSPTWTVNVLSITGSVLATYSLYTGSWTTGGGSSVSASQSLEVETGTSLSGDDLALLGTGSFSGELQTYIP
ncbi:MAG: hypothetical protein L3K19_02890 [Thermoplasmata archaeon]|nr:hypothetical protein [Thermoplasmata archaeon]